MYCYFPVIRLVNFVKVVPVIAVALYLHDCVRQNGYLEFLREISNQKNCAKN